MPHPVPIPYVNGDQFIHKLDKRGNLIEWCQDWSCPCTSHLVEQALMEIRAIEIDKGLTSRLDTDPDLPAEGGDQS